jgi:hypothetical protein
MAKTQKEMDDDVRYRNRFRDGGNDEPMKRHQKKVFDRSSGTFKKPATETNAKQWWGEALGKHSQNKRAAARTKKKIEGSGG